MINNHATKDQVCKYLSLGLCYVCTEMKEFVFLYPTVLNALNSNFFSLLFLLDFTFLGPPFH